MSTPGWAPIADLDATFTSTLRRAGWWTGYVTDNPFLGFSSEYAPFRRSFNRFERIGGQVGRPRPPASVSRRQLDHWLVPELREPHIERRVRAFLAAGGGYWNDERLSWAARVYTRAAGVLAGAAAGRRPFALVVDTFEPHEPWTPPRAYIDLYGDPDYRGPEPCMARYSRVSDYLKPARRDEVVGRMRDLYAAEVTMTDRWMGVLLDWLDGLGLAADTIVMLVADHGFLLGEHGWTGKIASMLHPPLIHVPFVVRDPGGRRAGGSTDWLAQTHDLGPTLLDMTGVRRPETMNGASLAPLLRGERPRKRRPMAFGGYANWHYARTDRWSFVAANTGRGRRLYDLRSDPRERHDVASRHPKLIDELERRVRRAAGGRLPVYE
jgi:arylsulfatase A-like enzyme